MDRTTPVREIMTTDVLTFAPGDTVETALRTLVDRGIDGAPIVDTDRRVVGLLSDGDLILREAELPTPRAISLLGAIIELGGKRFDEDLRKALGATVAEAMTDHPVTIGPDETVEHAATVMHEKDVSRLPVVDAEGRLLGIVSRHDILKVLLAEG